MYYANGIEFAGRYELIKRGAEAKGERMYCKYTEGRVGVWRGLEHAGWLGLVNKP